MAELELTTVTRTQGNNKALKDGTVRPRSFEFEFIEVDPLIDAFRRMVRTLEFDLSEMAMTTYITAREHGKKMVGLPIFLMRAFHHGAIVFNTKSGIRSPKDLEGRKVGVNRGYTVTTGLWARTVLATQYGVDLSKITWVLSGDEHVAEFRPPANVVPIEKGRKMADLVASGELPAAIGVEVDHPDVKPLIPDAKEVAFEALRTRGHYPINHLMVIREDLLARHPGLGPDIFDAFTQAKKLYVEKLKAGTIEKPTAVDQMYQRVMDITGRDPLPYGVPPNRSTLEEIIRNATAQKVLTRPVTVEQLFPPNTLDLVG
ncbi:MAG TPA: ABC transporter substrate-binding protein [Usitatibacter sp.]|nr:ABC transporter substrate-binding protein [Usitatibacter sp.]